MRLMMAALLLILSGLLLLVALGALHPRLDAARMLLAANGSIVRGFIGAAVVTALVAGLGARLGRAVMPRLVVAGRVVGALAVVAALANIATWTVGLDRRDVEFVSDGARLKGTLMLPSVSVCFWSPCSTATGCSRAGYLGTKLLRRAGGSTGPHTSFKHLTPGVWSRAVSSGAEHREAGEILVEARRQSRATAIQRSVRPARAIDSRI